MGRQSEIERSRERYDGEDLESGWWVWSMILTMLALATMGLATLFRVSIG